MGKHFIGTGHLGYHKVFHTEPNCEYYEHCNVRKIREHDCRDFERCQTWKYFERYGIDKLGVGAIMINPKSLNSSNS